MHALIEINLNYLQFSTPIFSKLRWDFTPLNSDVSEKPAHDLHCTWASLMFKSFRKFEQEMFFVCLHYVWRAPNGDKLILKYHYFAFNFGFTNFIFMLKLRSFQNFIFLFVIHKKIVWKTATRQWNTCKCNFLVFQCF